MIFSHLFCQERGEVAMVVRPLGDGGHQLRGRLGDRLTGLDRGSVGCLEVFGLRRGRSLVS
jgi:hypothetical protein